MSFSGSAQLAHQFEVMPSADADAAIRRILQGFPGGLSDSWVAYMARSLTRMRFFQIENRRTMSQQLRATGKPTAAALADFLEFQSIATPQRPFAHDALAPDGIDKPYAWAAQRLHSYGELQSKQLGVVAAKLCRWAIEQGHPRVDIIESPLGATIPAQVIAGALRSHGIVVRIHEFLSPRLDRHGTKHSVRAAAKALAKHLASGDFPVLFPDEILTGTRFKKLHGALKKKLGSRLVPVGLEVASLVGVPPDEARLRELRTYLKGTSAAAEGAPTHTVLSPALSFKVDEGMPIVLSSPFFWAESDICAGKRKVSLLFGLIDLYRHIAHELSHPEGRAISVLSGLWGLSTDGIKSEGHEQFISQIVPPLAARIDWETIEASAKREFPDDYLGAHPNVSDDWVISRQEWILRSIYLQFSPTTEPTGPSEAHTLLNALRALFASLDNSQRPPLPRDRDFCETTIPYALPMRAFHEELVRLVMDDVPPLHHLPKRA
jgi:hypothetical protein